MKNYIKVKNFKKYIESPKINLNDLNFFVGTNSSGKSTLVKAYMLITKFIKSDQLFEIDFSSSQFKDLNIQDFKRQFCFYSESNDIISIELKIDKILYLLELKNHDLSNYALVHSYEVIDTANNISYKYKNEKKVIDLGGYEYATYNQFSIRFINNETFRTKIIKKIEKDIVDYQDNEILNELNGDLLKVENKENLPDSEINFFSAHSDLPNSFKTSIDIILNSKQNIISRGLDFMKIFNKKMGKSKSNSLERILNHYRINIFQESNRFLQEGGLDMINDLTKLDVIFLPLHYRKYSNLNSIVDNSNDLAQYLHQYYSTKDKSNGVANQFITEWINKDNFNIGEDFKINFYGSESYEVLIFENNHSISLNDKGSGNIQIFKILLIVATQIKNRSKNCTIVLEEPELNLHPSMQSKLADLFSYINNKFGLKIIVETHSEYLIRRLQVLAIQNNIDREKIGITYFPTELDQNPYNIKINKDGSLDKNFGSGFFDEASNHTLELIKFKRLSQN